MGKGELIVKAIRNGNGIVKDWWYVAKEVKPICMYAGKWKNYVLVENHIDRSRKAIADIEDFIIIKPGNDVINNRSLIEYIAII